MPRVFFNLIQQTFREGFPIFTLKRASCVRRPEVPSLRLNKGFSLVELLVVIAIIGIMATLATVGFRNISVSRGVAEAAANVTSLLEFARNEAVTRQSYVWVALQEATNNGALEVQMVAAYSADGSTTGGGNLTPLSRVLKVRNTGLTSFSALKSETKALSGGTATVEELFTSNAGITITNFPATKFLNKSTITFTPRGEAMLKGIPQSTDGFNAAIGIGLVPARGTQKFPQPDDAGVILDGSTGMARVLRL